MLDEAIKLLNIQKDHWYIDCNLGGGGHTTGILQAGGKVLGLDLDPDAISEVAKNYHLNLIKTNYYYQAISDNLILVQTNFAKLKEVASSFNIEPSGVLFDLGVSSYQLEKPAKGFSFNTDAPLDMRMDPNLSVTAADLVNGLHEKELADIFWKFGEENFARPIAKRIIEARLKKKIKTTNELAQIILSVRHRSPSDRTHPATRIFQALRIAVNDELGSLEEALPEAVEALMPNGRLVVISFHSLEDRIVKDFLINEQENNSLTIITQKPMTPLETEVESNPRSRSGKLRAAQKI